jgi:hypothetical protein
MKAFTRTLAAAGILSVAAAGTAKADAPDLSAFQSSGTFVAVSTGVVNITYLFARAEYTNDLVLFVSVGGAGVTLITVPGNYPNIGVGVPPTVALPVVAGQSLLFGICSSGGQGGASPACPGGYGAWYMGPPSNNVDNTLHAAILSAAQWNTAATGIGCTSATPPCYLAPNGTTVVGFEDLPNLLSDHDFNDLVFSFDNVTTAPEPGTMGLLALGLVGLSGASLIRRRSAKRRS